MMRPVSVMSGEVEIAAELGALTDEWQPFSDNCTIAFEAGDMRTLDSEGTNQTLARFGGINAP